MIVKSVVTKIISNCEFYYQEGIGNTTSSDAVRNTQVLRTTQTDKNKAKAKKIFIIVCFT